MIRESEKVRKILPYLLAADFGLRLIGISCFTLFIAIIYNANGKASEIGFIGFATIVPALLVVLYAGKYTARLSSLGTVRILTNARAMLFVIAGIFANDMMSIIVTASLHSLIHQASAGAKMALDAENLDNSQRILYNARKTMLGNVAIIVGPPLGGIAISYFGTGSSLFVMAALSAGVSLILHLISSTPAIATEKHGSAGPSPFSSLRHLVGTPTTAVIVAMYCLISIILEIQAPLLFPFVREVYGRGSDYTGLLLGLAGVGGIGGAFLAHRFPKHLAESSISWLVCADGLIFLLFTQLHNSGIANGLFILLGLMGSITLIVVEGSVQRDLAAIHRPFVFSLMQFAAGAGGASVGIGTAFLAESFGTKNVLACAAGIEIAFGGVCLIAWRLAQLKVNRWHHD